MYQMNPPIHFQQADFNQMKMNYHERNGNPFDNINVDAINNLGTVINSLVNSRMANQQKIQNSTPHHNNQPTMHTSGLQHLNNLFAISNNSSSQKIDDNKCHVCGDKSTGSHFGGISCESCKAFFRRSVQKNRHEEYKCSYSGHCKMNISTRKICQFCRFKTCTLIGMKSKWVLSDDERRQKYGNRRKHQKTTNTTNDDNLKDQDSMDCSSSSESALKAKKDTSKASQQESQSSTPVDYNQENNVVGDETMNLSSDCVDLTTYTLSANEKRLIDRLSLFFYHSRKYNSLDLNLQQKLSSIFQSHSGAMLKKMSKVILANFIVMPVKRVITFAKLITDFRQLDINDQLALLQSGSMEIFICSSSSLYDVISKKIENIVSKDRKIEGSDESNIQLDILRLIWSEEIFLNTIRFLKSMNELKIDEATLILLIPIILFSPDRRNLVNKSRVAKLQSNYSFILKKYIVWKYGKKMSLTLFPKLLLKLVELRRLNDMHSSILLDAEQSKLDPFPISLLLNKKEDIESQQTTKTEQEVIPEKQAEENQKTSEKKEIQEYNHYNSAMLTPDSISSAPNSALPVSSVDSFNECYSISESSE